MQLGRTLLKQVLEAGLTGVRGVGAAPEALEREAEKSPNKDQFQHYVSILYKQHYR